jgi:hypothetical protein
MYVRKAKPGVGFDCDVKLSKDNAVDLFQAGFQFAERYIPLPGVDAKDDIDAEEAAIILEAGLDLRLVQHVRYPNWVPSSILGRADAVGAVAMCKQVGYSTPAHVWCDVEGVGGSSKELLDYLNAWSASVCSAGYKAGLYVGFGVPLTSTQLYELPGFDQYHCGANVHLGVATRGYSIMQLEPTLAVGGVKLDVDVTCGDSLGDFPYEVSPWPA